MRPYSFEMTVSSLPDHNGLRRSVLYNPTGGGRGARIGGGEEAEASRAQPRAAGTRQKAHEGPAERRDEPYPRPARLV